MIRAPSPLRLHTCFYLLCVSLLVSGGLGLVGHICALLTVPENLMIPQEYAAALLLAGAMIAVLIWRSRVEVADRTAYLFGALGVMGTFLLVIIAGWGLHQERQRAASAIVEHHAAVLEREMHSSAALIGRLAYRWSALGMAVPAALEQAEIERLFSDIPAVQSFLVITSDRQTLLHESRAPAEGEWLRSQLRQPEVLRWMSESLGERATSVWITPDSSTPQKAMLITAPGGATGTLFFTSFEIEPMMPTSSALALNKFALTVTPEYADQAGMPTVPRGRQPEIFQQATVQIPAGPAITVAAAAGPSPLFSLQGMLLPCILLFGLLVSYLLAMGRSLNAMQRQKSRELAVEEQRFRSLFFQSPDAVFELSRDGRYLSLNAWAQAFTGIGEKDLGRLHYRAVLRSDTTSDQGLEVFETAFQQALTGSPQTFAMKFLTIDGAWRDYECSLVPVLVDGAVSGVYAVVKDITERFIASEHQRLLTRSLESSDNGVLVVDVRNQAMRAVFVNSAFSAMTGYSREQVLNSSLTSITGWIDRSDAALLMSTINKGESRSFTVKSFRQDGQPFWNQVSLTPVRDEGDRVTHYTAIMKDVSEKREREKQLAYHATHDVLTGLANRFLLEDRLVHDIALAKRNGTNLAVLFVDLDAFKPINDTLGHRVGDEVLLSVSKRLQTILRPTDTLARFGGDEFVLLLPNLETQEHAETVASRVLSEIGRPHRVGVHELYVTASIGISFLTRELDVPAKLLQQCDMAMYKAKQQGRDTFVAYSTDLDVKLTKRVVLRNELQEAIRNDQLFLHYQPQVDLHGRICGLEALVRWRHPTKGLISPADFIPIAEETAQIIHLGHWVINQACKDAHYLLRNGLLQGRMAINLSPLQFHRAGFLLVLNNLLTRIGLPPACLELEVTEGILMRNSEGAIELLREMKNRGIATSIDDFGTGYSSFGYLKDLPVESVKIDKSFVDTVLSDRRDAAVCKGIITMAAEMGIKVVAEGVENREQFERLKGYGCEAFQGFYFARPMGVDELIPWIQRNLVMPVLIKS